MTTSRNKRASGRTIRNKLWWLILGRLAAALLLFLVGTIWTRGGSQQALNKTVPVLLIVIGLTIIYSLAHRLSRTVHVQARLQFAIDIVLVSWLLWNSDVIHSPYIALYIVIIGVSSLFIGPRDAIVTSVGCAVAFTACALAVILGVGQRTPEVVAGSLSQTVQSVGLFDVAFLVVGLLSSRLAERQSSSDVRLLAAT